LLFPSSIHLKIMENQSEVSRIWDYYPKLGMKASLWIKRKTKYSTNETSSADPLCLRRDSTRAPTITEVLEVEKKNNGVVTTMFGFSEEFKHLVNPTHHDDKDFDSEQTQDEEEQQVEAGAEFGDGDKERETSKINEGHTLEEGEEEQMEADTEVEEPVQVERQNEEDEIRNKSIRRIKRKEKMKRMRKLRRNFKMKLAPDGYESPCNYDDTKGAPNEENEKEENSGGKRNATDDENDEEEISDTQQLTEVNILGENENTEKITLDEDTEKK
ncbi:unnamed protein product, partial [Brassica rapa subsp. trilocularis]